MTDTPIIKSKNKSKKKIPMIGRKFNELTVIAEIEQKGRHLYYKCVCSCGGFKIARGDALRSGITKQCNHSTTKIGDRFGRLEVIKDAGRTKWGDVLWECVCDCGNVAIIASGNLRSGHTKSCGCLNREATTKHGMYNTKTYTVWQNMLARCNNPNDTHYLYYGGRGIMVCERWNKFKNFFEDMGIKPTDLTLERIDNNKGYYKENCCWDTRAVQARNRRVKKNNKTGVTGVYWNKKNQNYQANLKINDKTLYLGSFDTIELAAIARKAAELKYWGKEA